MTALYALTEKALQLMAMDDLPDDVIQDTLEGLGIDEKISSIVAVIKNVQADADAYAAEVKRLQEIKKSAEAKADRLRDYIQNNMEALGMKKAGTVIHQATLAAGSKSVLVENEALIPSEFVRVERVPIKADIAKALKDGVEVPGCKIVTGKASLRIK